MSANSFDLQGFGHLRGEPNWKFFNVRNFLEIAKSIQIVQWMESPEFFRENVQFLSFWQDGCVLDSLIVGTLLRDSHTKCLIQCVGKKHPSCVCWNQHVSSYCGTPNGSVGAEDTWIWIGVCRFGYKLQVILIIWYHIQSSILGVVNDDGAHIYRDEPHPGEKQRWLLCFSEPKRSLLQWWKLVTARWAVTKTLVICCIHRALSYYSVI